MKRLTQLLLLSETHDGHGFHGLIEHLVILGGRDGGQAEGVHLFERTIGMRDPWRNRMVSSLDTRGNLIIMVRRRGQVIIPKGDTVLQAGDILLINDMDGDPLT